MGTRADFYIRCSDAMEWLGSIAWDGYPEGIPRDLLEISEPIDYRSEIIKFIEGREDGTIPEDGWPWPWEDSGTTDFAYCFDKDKVWASCFCSPWFDPLKDEVPDGDGAINFPKMRTDKSAPAGSKKSGIFVIAQKGR